jgi:hypothetical protein
MQLALELAALLALVVALAVAVDVLTEPAAVVVELELLPHPAATAADAIAASEIAVKRPNRGIPSSLLFRCCLSAIRIAAGSRTRNQFAGVRPSVALRAGHEPLRLGAGRYKPPVPPSGITQSA